MTNSHPTMFMMTIDTEEEWDWSGPCPTTNLKLENIRAIPRFQNLCDQYGIAATYFTNWAVFENPESLQILKSVAGRSEVEIGMHIHPWNTPPLSSDPIPTSRSTFLHNLPADEIRAKLTTVYSSMVRAGFRPTSFRGGRYSCGPVVHEFLQRHGFVAECSVVPYTSWVDEGAPDYRHRDLFPVRLPAGPGQPALWELPLSLGFSRRPFDFWASCLRYVENSWLGKLRLVGIAERLSLIRRVWLNFEIGDRRDWTPFLNLVRSLGVPVVCFTVHSSSLCAGPGPYTKNPHDEARIFSQLEHVFAGLSKRPDFVSATASTIALNLEQAYARTGN